MGWMNRYPALSARARWAMGYVPRPLEQRMLAFVRARAPRETLKLALEPDPVLLSEWKALISDKGREVRGRR